MIGADSMRRENPFSGGLIAKLNENAVAPHVSTALGRQSAKAPRNLLNGNPKTYFQSEREPTLPWFMIHFTEVKVKMMSYKVRGWGTMSSRSWVIEQGGDELGTNEWVKIDEQRKL
jgi:hypothetical protein